MDTSYQRLEAKIDASNTRLEAIFKELLSVRDVSLSMVGAEVNSKVSNPPPNVSKVQQAPLPPNDELVVSNNSGDNDGKKGDVEYDVVLELNPTKEV